MFKYIITPDSFKNILFFTIRYLFAWSLQVPHQAVQVVISDDIRKRDRLEQRVLGLFRCGNDGRS